MGTKHIFYSKPITEIDSLVNQSASFTVMGVRDFGRSAFLKEYIALHDKQCFIMADIYELSEYSRINLLRLLFKKLSGQEAQTQSEAEIINNCKTYLLKLLKTNQRVVIIMNRIDLVTFKIDDSFFAQLRALISVDPKKISFIFGTCRKISDVAPNQISGSSVLFFSRIYHLPLYSNDDLLYLVKKYGLVISDQEVLNRALLLSGGHFQLFQLLLKKNFANNNPLKDEFILLALKSIYANLTYKQRTILQKVALGKSVVFDDDYLLQTKMIYISPNGYELFSPLFKQYLQLYTGHKLPVKERKLFNFLKKNIDSIVSRDTIFNEVWGIDLDNATDWALDALVYRLRKHPFYTQSRYTIVNHKKQGYSLIES